MLSHAKGILANCLWGLVPAYYYLVSTVDTERMVAYRFVFTFLLLVVYGAVQRKSLSRASLRHSLVPGLLLTVNAYVYLFAVLDGHVLEAAYGYLMTPILTIVCVRFLLGGLYTPMQWFGAFVCFAAIAYYALATRTLPWYGLGIALPFALYLTWHKHRGTPSSLDALRHESIIMLVLPVLYFGLTWPESKIEVFAEMAGWHGLIIAFSGIMTVTPLALFVSASSGLSAIHLGLYQFIAPVISAAVAVTLFGEHLTIEKLVVGVGLMLGLALAVLPLGRIVQGWRGQTIAKREIE